MTKDEQNLLRDFTELGMELVKLSGDVKLKDMEADKLRRDNAEILQAHTALVARLHDVTTQLEAERAAHEDQMVSAMHEIDMLRSERDEERARIAGAPVGTARFDAHEWLTLDDADLDESCDGQRFALVKLDKERE
jgi:chromosome segregation ATPase